MAYFVLADCNNFFASCECLFNPKLIGKPVIVLSNNDGCVVARSQEAKLLGIKMGEPYFKIKEQCRCMGVRVFSSNFELYNNLSQRIMNILSEMCPEIEIYSIDEAFLKFPADLTSSELYLKCLEFKKKIKKWVGISVSFGISTTKTLAKVANDLAKKNRDLGVCDLSSPKQQKQTLENYPLNEIWGIGRALTKRFNTIGIFTAEDFCKMDPQYIRKKFGIVSERMLWELRGFSCLELMEVQPKQSITCSRSFGTIITEEADLAEALATFVHNACIKLRRQRSSAQALCIFLEAQIEPGKLQRHQYSTTVAFSEPTQDTPHMISAAKQALKKIFVSDKRYKKCGIVLLDLIPEAHIVPDFFSNPVNPKRKLLMHTMDFINDQYGKNTLIFGAMGVQPKWRMRKDHYSHSCITDWNVLPIANAR